jgi:hypothetical protein
LELVQINVQGAIETKGSSYRRDDLGNESVQIGEAGRRDTQVLLANVINCLVINLAHRWSELVHSENEESTRHERTIGVLKGRVGRKNGIVGFDNGARQLRCGVHAKLELRLLTIISRQTFKQECTEAGPCSSAEGMEDEEALQT